MLSVRALRSAVTQMADRPVQSREKHLQGGEILGGRFVQHLRDPPPFVVLRAHQPAGERAHLIVRVVQFAFRRLAGGNVFVDDNRSRDALVRVPDRDGRGLDDLPDAVERLDLDDFIDGGFAVGEGAHRRPLCRREPLSGGVPPPLAFGVPLGSGAYRPAPDAFASRITEDDVPGTVNDADADGERIQYQAQEALASPQRFFAFPQLVALLPEPVLDLLSFAHVREQRVRARARHGQNSGIHLAARNTCCDDNAPIDDRWMSPDDIEDELRRKERRLYWHNRTQSQWASKCVTWLSYSIQRSSPVAPRCTHSVSPVTRSAWNPCRVA